MSLPTGADGQRTGGVGRAAPAAAAALPACGNYDPRSVPGILIHNPCGEERASQAADAHSPPRRQWIISEEPFSPEDFGLNPDDPNLASCVPDLSIDPETNLFTVINASASTIQSFFVTFTFPTVPVDENGRELVPGGGETVTETGEKERTVTFLLVLKPSTCADVCYLEDRSPRAKTRKKGRQRQVPQWRITSDVKAVKPHTSANEVDVSRCYAFPLGEEGPYLCSQGFNGKFTHFYPGTYHAVDFQCPVNTPVLSLGRGRIHSVRQDETVSGIHVSNLFRYNSVMVAQDDGLFVEYVHIARGSCPLAVGDAVEAGDRIADSGDVGFCPVPHLHIQAHESPEDASETVPWTLKNRDGRPYIPVAGQWRSAPCGTLGSMELIDDR